MRKTLTASLMMVGLVVMGAPNMGAFVVIDDDFSSYPIDESLVGKTAPTGQTLEALRPNWTTFAATRPWGIGGNPAMGLGFVDNDPGAPQSDYIWYPFGMALEPSDDGDDTNAILTVQWDAKLGEEVVGFYSLIEVSINEYPDPVPDPPEGRNVVWSNYHTSDVGPHANGGLVRRGGQYFPNSAPRLRIIPYDGPWVRHTMRWNLDTSEEYYEWSKLDAQGNVIPATTVDSGIILIDHGVTGGWAPVGLEMRIRGYHQQIVALDNLYVELSGPPLPPTLDFTWDVDSFGDWTSANNWTPFSSNAPPGKPDALSPANHTATFGAAITSNRTVVTDTAVSVRAITFDNTNSYVVAGSGSVNLIAATAAGLSTSITGIQGTHQFQVAVNLLHDTSVDVASNATLTFNNTLDLMNNTLTKTGGGTMAIRNDLVLGGGTVEIQQGMVSGNGTIGGDVNNDGGTISPGNNLVDGNSGVPEPTAVMLLALGGLGWAMGIRRLRTRQPIN